MVIDFHYYKIAKRVVLEIYLPSKRTLSLTKNHSPANKMKTSLHRTYQLFYNSCVVKASSTNCSYKRCLDPQFFYFPLLITTTKQVSECTKFNIV